MRKRFFYTSWTYNFLEWAKGKGEEENAMKEQGDKRLGEIILNKVNIYMLMLLAFVW